MSKRLTKPKGERVTLLCYDPPKEAVVEDLLSVQFTCRYDDGTDTLAFRFYADKGDTWEDANDD